MERFGALWNASEASRQCADLGVILAILERLRDGRTNQAYELLEGRVDMDILSFVASYRELPESTRAESSLKVLEWARRYRAKHPFKQKDSDLGPGIAEAFMILDDKRGRFMILDEKSPK